MGTLAVNAPQISFRREEPAMADFVEQKNFTTEVKRLDSEITNIKKAEEKQEKTVFEAIKNLREDVKDLREDMKNLERGLRSEIHSNFRWLIGMYITGTIGGLGVILTAFYYFASYIKG